MNVATGVAFVFAAVFACGDWFAVGRKQRTLEYVCKPGALIALIAAAALLDPVASAGARRSWFVAALVCSLAGDVLLMLDGRVRDLFVAGLAAFLVGHVFYVVGFWTDGPSGLAFALAAVIVVVVVGPIAARILGALRGEPALRPPVAAYIGVISVMVATALATGNVVAAVGAILFAASDSMIAWNRFVRPFRGAGVAIMVTYHLGQAGLVLSLLRS